MPAAKRDALVMEPSPIIVDKSVAPTADPAELTAWMSTRRIFISGVIDGLERTRIAVADAIENAGARAVLFERFGGRDDNPESAYLSELAGCDVYVGILGFRYGRPLVSGYSATHTEFNEALRLGQRVSIWVSRGEHDGRQNDFVEEVGVFNTYGSYGDDEELTKGVVRRLQDLASEAVCPWAKLGQVVFRTTLVRSTGGTILVEATTRDNDVLAAVLRLREPIRQSGDLLFTHDLGSTAVRVNDIVVESAGGSNRRVEINLRDLGRPSGDNLVDVSTDGRTPEEITELALRIALFGEANPLGMLGFMAKIPNPFDQILTPLSEEVVESIVRVLFSEALVASGRAERITAFRLGPSRLGRRPLALSWLPRKRYTNVDPIERHIEGVTV
jgi:hypothetical protein